MSSKSFTVVYEDGGKHTKLVKVWYGNDGSYYVMSPYHSSSGKAIAFRGTVNYAKNEQEIPFSEMIDSSSFDDDAKKLKLSHHVSGLVQFSGEGITSGEDEQGNPKGVAVRSWPLTSPVRGPCFAVLMCGVERYAPADTTGGRQVRFAASAVFREPGANGLILEGYYFPRSFRRFLRPGGDGNPIISNVHPNGIAFDLKVILPDANCRLQNFLGLHLYSTDASFGGASDAFSISGSTGMVRRNENGEQIADGIFAEYPRSDVMPIARSLAWPPLQLPDGNRIAPFT